MSRTAKISRKTKETNIAISVNLDGVGDGAGSYKIKTGLFFFDHMLEQLSHHSGIDMEIDAKGDLAIDSHHTVEDVAITLASAIKEAVGNKKGINRFGFAYIPMDEALTRVVVDLSGRPYTVFKCNFTVDKIGDVDSEMFREFFIAFANNLGCNLHIENLYGINNHHIIESCFKGLAKAIKTAIAIRDNSNNLASTKGLL